MKVEVSGHPNTDKVFDTLARLLCDQRGLEYGGITREEKNCDGTNSRIAIGSN